MKKYFELSFIGIEDPELWETAFEHPAVSMAKKVVRGKSGGAFITFGSFQWTRGVKALALLMLRSIHHARSDSTTPVPMLIGGRESLAASLDYAIDKRPLWLIDMFGIDSLGNPLVPRILKRTNPGRKRPGPTAIALNSHFLPPEAFVIRWNGNVLTTPEEIETLINSISWESGLDSRKIGSALITRAAS